MKIPVGHQNYTFVVSMETDIQTLYRLKDRRIFLSPFKFVTLQPVQI